MLTSYVCWIPGKGRIWIVNDDHRMRSRLRPVVATCMAVVIAMPTSTLAWADGLIARDGVRVQEPAAQIAQQAESAVSEGASAPAAAANVAAQDASSLGTDGAATDAEEKTYDQVKTVTSGEVVFSVEWNAPILGEAAQFHLSAQGGSGSYNFLMQAPEYRASTDDVWEAAADTEADEWSQYTDPCANCDYEFTMRDAGSYRLTFHVKDEAGKVEDFTLEIVLDIAAAAADPDSDDSAAIDAAAPAVSGDSVVSDEAAGSAAVAAAAADAAPAGARIVVDGDYTVRTVDDPYRVLDVMGGSTDDGANLALYRLSGVRWQRFTLTWDGSGCYTIACANSGKLLTAAGEPGEPGNVYQAAPDGSDAQKWVLEDAGDGRVRIYSKATGLCLDVEGGHAGDSVNVRTWERTDNNSGRGQAFTLEAAPESLVSEGTYVVESLDDSVQVLDVMGSSFDAGANVALYENRNSSNQKFRLEPAGDGWYRLVVEHSGQCLDVVAAGSEPGTNVTQWPTTWAGNQLWAVEDAGDGWYRLRAGCSGLYLDVEGGHAGNSVNVRTWERTDNNSGAGQKFRFGRMVDDGVYFVGSADDPSKVLDVVAGSREDGANVTLWDRTGASNQRFEIHRLYGRVYKVSCTRSWRALDVVAGCRDNGTNVTQWSQYGTDNQSWLIDVLDDGSVTFRSIATDNYLDVEGGHAGAGVNVQTWERTDNNSGLGQQWRLEKAGFEFKGIDSLVSSLEGLGGWGLQTSNALNQMSATSSNALWNALYQYWDCGASVGFIMVDLGTGASISYNSDERFWSCSTIKGPYVAALNMYSPWTLNYWEDDMWEIILNSPNPQYMNLRDYYGSSPLYQLAGRTHAYDFDWDAYFTDYSAKTLGKLWVGMADYFLSDRENAWWCRSIFSSNNWITSRPTLDWKGCTVYAKSGWITNYHDEGYIVMDGDHPYLAVIMSSASPNDSWLMSDLINALDMVHTDII